jgi:hypothetical protein
MGVCQGCELDLGEGRDVEKYSEFRAEIMTTCRHNRRVKKTRNTRKCMQNLIVAYGRDSN